MFLGPSLPHAEARAILPARYLGPVQCGDLLRVRRLKPRAVAIIDGVFEGKPPVWHKEILLAMEDGIAVFGAASMGALRAAELAPFGMVGIGQIFESYRAGACTDDDEVALMHGSAALGYQALTEPMVNIRSTVARAVDAGAITARTARRIADAAKSVFYQDRTMDVVVARAWRSGAAHPEAIRFRRFLERGGYVNQKRLDAIALLRHIGSARATPSPARASSEPVNRARVLLKLHHEVMCRPFTAADPDLPIDEHVALEARLLGTNYRLLRRLAQLMSLALALSPARAAMTRPPRSAYAPDDFGLGPAARTRHWLKANGLTAAGRQQFVARLTGIRRVVDAVPRRRDRPDLTRRILDLMRLEGRFAWWRAAAGTGRVVRDRAIFRRVSRLGGVEFALYRRIARLWQVVDAAASRSGVASADEPQSLFDEFRLSRGLILKSATLAWMRDSNLDHQAFGDLVKNDARLTLLTGQSRAYTLGLADEPTPVCWLLDAIRLTALYPELRQHVAKTTAWSSDTPGKVSDTAALCRQHFAHIREAAPDDLERYACSLDFRGGEAEFLSTLATRASHEVRPASDRRTRRLRQS